MRWTCWRRNTGGMAHAMRLFGIECTETIGFKSLQEVFSLEQQLLRTILGNPSPQSQQVRETAMDNKQETRDSGLGELPALAPLANPYVPFQFENPERYTARKGLIRGTLFPGLDLPFLGMVNNEEKGDQGLAELQALGFAINELALYLDTHEEDMEAAELYQSYVELYQKGLAEYQKTHGPLRRMDAVRDGRYVWTKGPWPWEYAANEEG